MTRQKNNLKINAPACENRSAAKELHRIMSTDLKKDFNVHAESVFVINSFITIGDSKAIEALETYAYTDIDIEFDFENAVTHEIKKWAYKGKRQRWQ